MLNIYIWLGLLFTAFIATLVVGRARKAGAWDLFLASLMGILVRLAQFIILSLFIRFTPGLMIPRLLFGIVITGLLILGFMLVPFMGYAANKRMKEMGMSYGLFFYLGYFAAGFIQAYFTWMWV
jgi:hypothetical protein